MGEPTSRKLAIPRTGIQRATYGKQADLLTLAAWQTVEVGAPKRVVIRIDGDITKPLDANGIKNGFPCIEALVRYTIGGLTREVAVDCASQSALVVWCESCDVTPVFDTLRASRLLKVGGEGNTLLPCSEQTVVAAISACECGDTGNADARYLDVAAPDIVASATTSVLKVPYGARAVRFLPVLKTGAAYDWTADITLAYFTATDASGVVEALVTKTAQEKIAVPADARFLILTTANGKLANYDGPAFIEWIYSPNSVANSL